MAIDVESAAEKLEEHEAAPATVGPADGGSEPDSVKARRVGRSALAVSLAIVAACAGLIGWQGYRAFQSHREQVQRNLFLQIARQGALNLTTISYTEAEADVQRITDSATGAFREDFTRRSQPFIEAVKQAQSKSQGVINDAAVESEDGNSAQVLVAVTVSTSIAGVAEQQPRAWRMRIAVQRAGDGAKVSNVEFVP